MEKLFSEVIDRHVQPWTFKSAGRMQRTQCSCDMTHGLHGHLHDTFIQVLLSVRQPW